ncbi:MAG: ABC transporter permease [Candidatus Saliniplasma sp.]
MEKNKGGSYFGSEDVDIKQELKDLKEKETSQMELVWLRFKRNKLALFGAGVMIVLIITAIFAPFLAPYHPIRDYDVYNRKEAPTMEHPLGTDNMGRDTLSRLIYGARIALFIGILIVAISGGIGVTLGLIAGTMGGWVDEIIMRVVDTFMAFPVIVFAMGVSISLGMGLYPVIIAVGLIIWTRFARVTRADVLAIKQEMYIEGAEAIGESRFSIITRYFFPNVLPSIVVVATIQMPSALLYSATLNFLGFGAQPPEPSWGGMVNEGAEFMQFNPWLATFSGLAIVITVLAFNFMGDGLRDALDPIRGGE